MATGLRQPREARLAGEGARALRGERVGEGVQRGAVARQQVAYGAQRLVQQALHLHIGAVLDLIRVLRATSQLSPLGNTCPHYCRQNRCPAYQVLPVDACMSTSSSHSSPPACSHEHAACPVVRFSGRAQAHCQSKSPPALARPACRTRRGKIWMSVRPPPAYGCVSVRGPTAGASDIAAVATSLVTMRRAMTRRRWLMVLISSAPYTSSSAARPGAGSTQP